MSTNRRIWLKQSCLTIAGLALANETILSAPVQLKKQFLPGKPIRLHANENPYGPSPSARKAMEAAVISSNCYPWDMTTQLQDKLAIQYGLTNENILMGAGSSEILGLVAQYAALQKGNAVAADPTFGSWFTTATKLGLEVIKVPLTADKKHDLHRMKEKINSSTRLVYICNPNNPTGTVLPVSELKGFINDVSRNSIVLLDEAYTEYSDETTLAVLVKENPNLIIAKTFSKIYGLAGARIGYALAHTNTINKLAELQPWANAGTSAVSLAGAIATLDDQDFTKTSKAKNTAIKEDLYKLFTEYHISFIPSHTNFVYYSVKGQQKDFLAALAENNIRAGRLTETKEMWTRISIGTAEDMNKYSEILKQSFKS